MMIGSHAKNLPSAIIKMLVECLVFSRYTYALPVWGTAIHKDSLSQLTHLYNHVSQHGAQLGWLLDCFVNIASLPFHLFQDVAAFWDGLFTHLLQETMT